MHLHGIGPAFFAPLSRTLGFVTVVTHHAQDYRRPKWGIAGRLLLKAGEFAAACSAHAVICVSDALRNQFLSIHSWAARRTHVIRNAGGLTDANLPNESPVLGELGLAARGYILAVGRLEATKAFDQLIQAFQQARLADRKLVIVGSDAGNDACARNLRQHASDKIIFAGFQTGDALRRLYEEALLFVHPSSMEGYGLVIAEALSTGIPVIVSDIAVHREFGLDERCYFEPGNVEVLATLLRAPDYDVYRSPEARALLAKDSWDRVAREHLALISLLLPDQTKAATLRVESSDGS